MRAPLPSWLTPNLFFYVVSRFASGMGGTMLRAAIAWHVYSLTDSAFSPLADCSHVSFSLAEADHAGFRSLSASMAFAMALTVSVAERRRSRK